MGRGDPRVEASLGPASPAVACQSLPRLARAQFAGDRWHPAATQWNAHPRAGAETVPVDRLGVLPKSAAVTALLRPMIGAGVFGRRVASLGGKAGYIDLAAAARLAFGDRLRPTPGRRDDCPWAIATLQKKCQQTFRETPSTLRLTMVSHQFATLRKYGDVGLSYASRTP